MLTTSGAAAGERGSRLRRVAQHALDFEVFVEAELAPLAPIAAFLVTAEGCVEVEAIVDRYPPRAQLASHGASLVEIGGCDVPGESVLGVIGDLDGLVE